MPARKRSKPNPPEPTTATSNAIASQSRPSSGIIGPEQKPVEEVNQGAELSTSGGKESTETSTQVKKEQAKSEDNAPGKAVAVHSTREGDTEMTDASTQPRAVRSWYGTWQKAPLPGAQGTKSEKQTDAAPSTPSSSRKDLTTPARRSTNSHLSPGASSRSLPLTSTTRLNISSDRSTQSPEPAKRDSVAAKDPQPGTSSSTIRVDEVQPSSASIVSARTKPTSTDSNSVIAEPPPPWKGWFGKQRPESQIAQVEQRQRDSSINKSDVSTGKADSKPPAVSTGASISLDSPGGREEVNGVQKDDSTASKEEAAPRPKSWLGIWSGGKSAEVPSKTTEPTEAMPAIPNPSQSAAPDLKMDIEKANESLDKSKDPNMETGGNDANAGWAFWSRSPANASKGDSGELAVAGSSSQSQPEDAICDQHGIPKGVSSPVGTKRTRPASLEISDDSKSVSSRRVLATDKKAAELAADTPPPRTPPQRPVSRREDQQHLLLPLFNQTYPVEPESPNFLQQIGRLFYGKATTSKYPMRLREPKRIKQALAIGVHGYFPTALMQTVLGRPTGTSMKFAEGAARAIHRYAEKHQHSPISVEKIALEGEGRIDERLDTLWKLLLNWIDKIRRADFIILACHSQGVPVAMSLAAKLIGFGCVNGAQIGVCGMAGINLGPFVDYKSRFMGGSAGELFEFARPDSRVSKAYENALDTVLRFGAKVVYIGSMDDQLVSLQSSTFGTAEHPSIYRAVWIDGRVHISDFLTHLVGFALKLRNLGVPDHGLIRELSNPLAGSLVGGEGHSRVYEDEAVYDLAIEFTAETTSLHTHVLKISQGPSTTSSNPYILPFAMRGLLEEEFVRTELANEAMELLKQFDDWKPTTKVLRDVKYRLEGVRSKL